MAPFSWMAQEEELTAAGLTVRAQTVSPNDTGALLWDLFMPRQNVDSVKLQEIKSVDWRPVSDRREWNAPGRLIPIKTPDFAELEMVPIEDLHRIAEREMQHLAERTQGNETLFRNIIRTDIPARVEDLAAANYRRIEVDTFSSWALGIVTVMNPVTGQTVVVSYGFDVARYQTALTAWNNVGVNAYSEFLAWLEDGVDAVGPISGAIMRMPTYRAILADAPNPFANISGIPLTRAQLEQRLADDLGGPFQFIILENQLDHFTDGGINTTRTKLWPAEIVAAVPSGRVVGSNAFAPIVRAMDIHNSVPLAKIDIRGMSAFPIEESGGKGLRIEVQVNALPVPNEEKMWVIDAGV